MGRHPIYNIKGTRIAALAVLFGLAGCSSVPDGYYDDGAARSVTVDVALRVSSSHASPQPTRMSADVAQAQTVPVFRGIQDIVLIPFGVSRDIMVSDRPLATSFDGVPVGTATVYPHLTAEVSIGTTSFMGYGRAIPTEGDYFDNGYLFADIPATRLPADIRFSLVGCQKEDTDDMAQTIADQLTGLANVSTEDQKWSETMNRSLKALYNNFIRKDNLIASSSRNAKALLKEFAERLDDADLQSGLDDTDRALWTAIKAKITDVEENIPKDYPEKLNLPDGSVAIKWVETGDGLPAHFMPYTSTGSDAGLNDPSRFAYPAELYYRTNSQIRTSKTTEVLSGNLNSGDEWNRLVTDKYKDGYSVAVDTRSIAIENPLDYAVACLQTSIVAERDDVATTDVLEDAAGNEVPLVNSEREASFPLTALLVGGQFPQDFDFVPIAPVTADEEDGEDESLDAGSQQDIVEHIIYDKKVGNVALRGTLSAPIYTLVLQSRMDKPITVVLELMNNSGQAFQGYEEGWVYPGTKFYLAGEVWPSILDSSEDYERCVFTKDRRTVLTLKVGSLRSAYNVIPDLKTAQYTMRVVNVGVKSWIEDESEDHPLYNW